MEFEYIQEKYLSYDPTKGVFVLEEEEKLVPCIPSQSENKHDKKGKKEVDNENQKS